MIKSVALSLAALLSVCATACADHRPDDPAPEDLYDEEAAGAEGVTIEVANAPPEVRAEFDRFEQCLREHGVEVPGPGAKRILVHRELRGAAAEEGTLRRREVTFALRSGDPAPGAPDALPEDSASIHAPMNDVTRAALEACPPPRPPALGAATEHALEEH